ncbi:GNAT family N-acetyltransferase [Clostridium sp. MB40-C1]|uniref:GNAT family N-acetyltransferase n=1 Tax=Clostridium sp. MB40-C1 TaxID=3070996 RepID=UPI0027DF8C23|nr:GNAT family N-acetyltransferase [Clostridium sp. MB40-C1]WMJ80570.1 GNAT family N-acetyltransferase [Clostridium sp. MB40-C1]
MIVIIQVFEKFPILSGNVYNLRQVKETDCKDILDIYSDNDTVRYEGMNTIESIDKVKNYIEFINEGYNKKMFVRWGITYKEDDKLLGLISLHHFDYLNAKAEVGYILNKKYWGKGIMTRNLSLVINYAFNELKLHRLEAVIHPANIASINLAERLGFTIEGVKKECELNLRTLNYEDRLIMGRVKKMKKVS